MFGKKSLHDEYAKVIAEVRDGKRRQPKHDVPATLRGRYNPAKVDPVDQHVFDEFAWFGATLDWATDDAWSLEETSDTMRRAWYLDSPDYGRRWTIYYNDLRMGWVEASATPTRLFGTVEEFIANPSARVDMSLDMVRFVPADHVLGLLLQASLMMQSTESGGYEAALERAKLHADAYMVRYLWEVQRVGDEYVPDLDFFAEGPYAVYRETVAHWRKTGFDPFKEAREAR